MSNTIVIFGASGDLTKRKLIPALYRLHAKGRLPGGTRIVGFSRTPYSHDAWRQKLAASTREYLGDLFDATEFEAFAASVYYQPGDLGSDDDFAALFDKHLGRLRADPAGPAGNDANLVCKSRHRSLSLYSSLILTAEYSIFLPPQLRPGVCIILLSAWPPSTLSIAALT